MAKGTTIGVRLQGAELDFIDAHASETGLSRAGAVADVVRRFMDKGEAGAVLASLPKAPAPMAKPPRADLGKPRAVKAAAAQPETPPPLPGRVSVAAIDLPYGRPKPPMGSLVKGPKGRR